MTYRDFENPDVILCRHDDESLPVVPPADQVSIWQGFDSPTYVAFPDETPDENLEWVADRLNGRVSLAELITFRDLLQSKTSGLNL